MEIFTISLLCILLAFLFLSLQKNSGKAVQKLPPGPNPLPIIGNIHNLGKHPHKSLACLAQVYGPIMHLKLGRITTIVISSSTAARQVLQKQDLAFSTRPLPDAIRACNHFKSSVVWLPVGNQWRSLRKIISSNIFTANKLDANQHLRTSKVQELIGYCIKCSKSGEAVDIGRAAFQTSLNLLSNTIFSKDMADSYHSTDAKEFKDLVWNIMLGAGTPNLVDYFPILRCIDPQGIKRRMSVHFGKLLKLFDGLLNERLELKRLGNSDDNTDVLDQLLKLLQTNEIDKPHTKHLFVDLFAAGTDTTSSTLEWAMAEVLKYEGDQDKSVAKRLKSALAWVVTTAIVVALVLGILYGLVGKVDFTIRHLSSATESLPSTWSSFTSGQQCIGNGARQCSAFIGNSSSETTWTQRATFPEYVVALATIVGSVLFSIFGGVGIACLPLGLIFSFIRRPKAVITRSQYIKEATELGKKARELKKAADALHQEERSGSKGRKWRKNTKALEKELLHLEEDVKALEEIYPQGEKAETTWAMTVLGYLAKLVLGILGLVVSIAWIAHIVIYLLIDPPLSSFLNEVFIKLDDIWGLLGSAAFAFFCMYLLLAVIAGAMMLGLRLVFVTIHPMKWGATLMNSFLFNVGLILLCSISVIQFCSTAFAYYAQATAAQEIFGHTLQSLRGIKYLYKYNVFQIAFIVLAGLTFVYYAAFGWRRKKPSGRFQLSN